jgi:hypothetical protein
MAATGSITERRRFGAGTMVIAGTSAGSWASASQTVVVVTKTIIVQTTPYGAWFWVCIGFFGLGALMLASTFLNRNFLKVGEPSITARGTVCDSTRPPWAPAMMPDQTSFNHRFCSDSRMLARQQSRFIASA